MVRGAQLGAPLSRRKVIVTDAVERALYANVGSQVWGAGTNATATRLP